MTYTVINVRNSNLFKSLLYNVIGLIGQHKNNLISHSVIQPHSSQKTLNKFSDGWRTLQTEAYNKVTFQNSGSAASRYSKVNRTPQQNTAKQCIESTRSALVTETKSHIGQPKTHFFTRVSPLPVDTSNKRNREEKPSADNLKNISCSSSVHINPNFFRAASAEKDVATLRCKSVHINPRVLGAVTHSANSVRSETAVPKQLLAFPTRNLDKLPPDRTLECLPPEKLNESLGKQSTAGSSQIPTEKASMLVPLKTPTNRKKYVYRSKTKLVKAVVNAPVADCKLARKPGTPLSVQTVTKSIRTPHGGTLLAVSRTKLVRLPGKVRRSSSSKSDASTSLSTVTKSRYRLRRATASPVLRIAKKVSSKYRNATVVTMQASRSKYCLDRRLVKAARRERQGNCSSLYKVDHRSTVPAYSSPVRSSRVRGHLLLSPFKRSAYSNRVWASATSRAVQKVAISHRRLLRIGCNPVSQNHLQNSALVRIGGLLYKTSRTKLILSKTTEKVEPSKSRTIVKRRSLNAGHVVYVRGNKFVMDRAGKTLNRVVDDCAAPELSPAYNRRKFRVSRVDIGGVTFIQKTPTVLVRTNTHTARNLVSNAKQRSIAFLTQKMRKINTPCLFYRRFGRCPRQEKGRCELVHDPKYIDICRKFLQGKCILEGCLLSHDVGPEKMPTCRFFLEGCCVRDLCPYLHVKVNDRAPICHNFLQGYCEDGPECLKRHVLLCPEFDKNGSCPKGKYCPYPHSCAPRVQRAICSEPPITAKQDCSEYHADALPLNKRKRYYETDSDEWNEDEDNSPAPLKSRRYYEDEAARGECQGTQSDVDTSGTGHVQSPTEKSGNALKRRRSKIGELPSFIALESFEFD